jgi:hypothetical protein
MAAFISALERQTQGHSRRFQYFLNYLRLEGISEEHAKQFVSRARENPIWGEEILMSFIDDQKGRLRRGGIFESTITNYYKATKFFCAMKLV